MNKDTVFEACNMLYRNGVTEIVMEDDEYEKLIEGLKHSHTLQSLRVVTESVTLYGIKLTKKSTRDMEHHDLRNEVTKWRLRYETLVRKLKNLID